MRPIAFLLLIVGLVLAAGPELPTAQAQAPATKQGEASSYSDLLSRYANGDYDAGVRELARWEPERVRTQAKKVDRILFENQVPGVPPHMSAAARSAIRSVALIHIEVLVQGRWEKAHFQRAWSALETLAKWPNTKPFVESAYIILSSRLVYLFNPRDAQDLLRFADRTADVVLTLGSISESAHARGVGVPPPPAGVAPTTLRAGPPRFGSLEYTGDRFEEALRLDPSLTEARVRLGRVLVARGFADAAIAHLERARREAPEGFLGYLAALFLGAAHEQKGAWQSAADCYRAAMLEYPEAQAAYVALGHLQQVSGHPDEGWQTLRSLFGDFAQTRNPERDPWWVYFDAQTWQMGHRIDQMRATLRQ